MGGKGSGRLSKDVNTRQIQQTMTEAGVDGAKLIKDYIKGKDSKGNKVSLTMVKLTACLQSIAHAIGLPRQKVDFTHTGDQLTLKDLAELAELGDSELLHKALQDGSHPTVKLIPKTPKTRVN